VSRLWPIRELAVPLVKKAQRRTGRRRGLAVVSALLALAVPLTLQLADNFRMVLPGLVYRSGQLGAGNLRNCILRHKLRAVVNLRGANVEAAWYQDERAMALQCGASFYDLAIDSGYPPNPEELEELVTLLTTCEKPLLVHCNSGVERSGIVAAICILTLDPDGSLDKARQQLGLVYGQLPWRASAVRHQAFVNLYESWLVEHACEHTPGAFRDWALHVYQPPIELDNRAVFGSPQWMSASQKEGAPGR
jgi:hypothetical protein